MGPVVWPQVRGQLTKLERKTLSALIVIDVHARDVAGELASQDVQVRVRAWAKLVCCRWPCLMHGMHRRALGGHGRSFRS